jgi:GNAT superfamily N-acetyltransferase
MDFDLRMADDEPTRAAVGRLRYEVFVRERHTNPPDADHVGARIRDRLDAHAIVLAAIDRTSHAVLGTIRTNLLASCTIPVYPALYRLTDLSAATWAACSVTTYMAVAVAQRRHRVGAELCAALFDILIARGVNFDYLDCPTDVVPFYTRLGYRWLRPIRHPWFGPMHLMRLSLQDHAHLTAMRSPLVLPHRGVSS